MPAITVTFPRDCKISPNSSSVIVPLLIDNTLPTACNALPMIFKSVCIESESLFVGVDPMAATMLPAASTQPPITAIVFELLACVNALVLLRLLGLLDMLELLDLLGLSELFELVVLLRLVESFKPFVRVELVEATELLTLVRYVVLCFCHGFFCCLLRCRLSLPFEPPTPLTYSLCDHHPLVYERLCNRLD